VADATEAARAALENPTAGAPFSTLIAGGKSVAIVIDNQFRPTPQSKLLPAVLDAIEAAGTTDACVICANGKVFPMSESDIEMKLGRENLARMERMGIPFFQNDPRNAEAYTYVGVSSRGTPVWLHTEVARRDVKITIGQAQANHWGAGGGGKLILPGVVSDETIESNHCNFVPSPATHYGALAGPMRSDIDEVATMCGLDATMNVVLDTRGRVLSVNFGAHPSSHREAIELFNSIYAYESPVPQKGQADIAICGVFAPTDHLFFHTGWGCMSADLVTKEGATIIYTSPSPGVSTAVGDFPGLALMDLMTPYMPASGENYQRVLRDIHSRTIQMWAGCIWVPIYEVMTRKHLTIVTLEENLAMAAEIGIDATTSLDDALAAAMKRHGPDAKVIVLPYARYQLPSNAIRMHAEDVQLAEASTR
jgi:nickel-dependent lactate racemase